MSRTRAIAIIIKDSSLLVMWRSHNGQEYYAFPGGGVEKGEGVEEAVIREVGEETTVNVGLKQLLYKISYSDTGDKQYFYLCDYVSGEPKLAPDSPEEQRNKEGINLFRPMWLPLDSLPKTLLYPLEVRDWLIEDIANGLPRDPRIVSMVFSERRQKP